MRGKTELFLGVLLVALAVVMMSCSGKGGGSSTSSGDTTAPAIPQGLTATPSSSSAISVIWNAATDNVAVTGYKIYRNGTEVGTSAVNSYTSTGLSAGTAYAFTVAAYDAAGNNSTLSQSATASTLATGVVDTTAPSAPSNLTATAVTSSQINLSWTVSTDNVGVAGYEIYRGSSLVSIVTGTVFSDTGLLASTSYSYTVIAFDGVPNKSAQSVSASATTLASSATTYGISGTVTSSGTALQGVTMTLSGAGSATATTDASGNFTFTGLSNGNYTVTPSKTGYTFNPVSSAQTVNGANVTGVIFIASNTTSVACTTSNLQGTWINGTYNGQPTSNNAHISFSSLSWSALWGGDCTENGSFSTSSNTLSLNIINSTCGDAGLTKTSTCSISGSQLTLVTSASNYILTYTKQ